jgi:hypothetical protein
MMKLLKTKQPKQEASSEASDLAARIRQNCDLAEEYIERRVRDLKADPDHALLSIDWLRQDLKNRHGGNCSCRVALSLISGDKNDR